MLHERYYNLIELPDGFRCKVSMKYVMQTSAARYPDNDTDIGDAYQAGIRYTDVMYEQQSWRHRESSALLSSAVAAYHSVTIT